MSDTKNVKLGVCQVYFDGVDLGYTQGGVEVTVTTETHKVNVDQFGRTVIDEIIMGRNVEVKAPLAETIIETLARTMPGSTVLAKTAAGVDAVAASGTITIGATAPSAGDTVVVNGVTFTAKATAPAAANEFVIGANATATATNLLNAMKFYPDPRLGNLLFSQNAGVITVTYYIVGTIGNAVTLTKTGTNITVSGATLTGGTDAAKKKISVSTGVSQSLLQTYARKLVLHPKAKAATDKSEDFVVPLAATAGAMQFAYMLDKERIFNITFMGYPDPTTDVLYVVGDDSTA